MELIIIFIVIIFIIRYNRMRQPQQRDAEEKQKENSAFSGQPGTPGQTLQPNQPKGTIQTSKPNHPKGIPNKPIPNQPVKTAGQPAQALSDVQREAMILKKKVSSTDDPVSRLSLYQKVLIRDHYSTVSSVSKELHLPPSKVISDIKELQAHGYFKDVCIDRSGIHITYHHEKSQNTGSASVSTRIHAKGKMGQNADYLDKIPDGHHIVNCSYCGAGNVVPFGAGDFHCYFCWEQL